MRAMPLLGIRLNTGALVTPYATQATGFNKRDRFFVFFSGSYGKLFNSNNLRKGVMERLES